MYDETLLRLMRTMRGLTGNMAYPTAATEQVRWFLTHATLPDNGLLPWARQMGWDVMNDKPLGNPAETGYEWPRPWLLWSNCYNSSAGQKPGADDPPDCSCYGIVPEESKRFAEALLKYRSESKDPRTDVRQIGFDLRTWAAAYSHTRDNRFLDAVEKTLSRLDQPEVLSAMMPPTARLSAAIDGYGASLQLPEPLAGKLRAFAAREDDRFCGLSHDLKGRGGFFWPRQTAAGDTSADPVTPLWDPHRARHTTAAVGLMCVARSENGGSPRLQSLIVGAAEAYLQALPGENEDAWPLTAGQVISLELAAWRATADRRFIDRAREISLWAVRAFYDGRPLPKASLKSEHYENVTGADTLATALLEVDLSIMHITAVPHPANTLDR
jgi:hypothetical protein